MEVNRKERFLLASVQTQKMDQEMLLKELEELKQLVEAYGGIVVDLLIQKRNPEEPGMYIGKGKIAGAGEVIAEKKVDVVVLNAMVKSGQLFDIKKKFWDVNPDIKVWDRVDLILEIFAHHAQTAEAKLQIEIAAMRHMGPRIYGMGLVMSRQGGGIGGRGVGETNTELMKRHWRDEMKKTEDKLKKLTDEQEKQMERRQKLGMRTVSIIGYTNAGKTSLFNALTHKKKLVQNALFATLDSTVGKVYFQELKEEVLISDTIGFIRNLPTKLIQAFKSTLMESMHSDLLLHVIDVSDSEMENKIRVVEEILQELGIGDKRKIYVLNKADAAEEEVVSQTKETYKEHTPLSISVKEEKGIEELLKHIENTLQEQKIMKVIPEE
ncbi:GTPase HflX [soil metagenome]